MSLAILQNQISEQIENRTDLVLAYSDTDLHDCISIYQQNGRFWLSYSKDKLIFKNEAKEILNDYPVVDSPEFRPLTKTIFVGKYNEFWDKYWNNRQNEKLEKIGKVLFGNTWQTELANFLKNASNESLDSRRIRQWLNCEREVPNWVWPQIKHIVEQRKRLIDELISKL